MLKYSNFNASIIAADNNNDICGLTYPGPNAFSEPECEGLGNFISTEGNAGNLIMYLAIHSYSNLIIYPFGHTNVPVPNAAELVDRKSARLFAGTQILCHLAIAASRRRRVR
jgi:Zinc carboxypeptidase